MPSRFALGNNTNAIARFEALLRVMARLSCMNWLQGRIAPSLGANGRQAAGLGASGIEGPVRAPAPTRSALRGLRAGIAAVFRKGGLGALVRKSVDVPAPAEFLSGLGYG